MTCPTCNDSGRILREGVVLAEDAFDYRDCQDCGAAERTQRDTEACRAAVEALPREIARACRVSRGVIEYRPGRWGIDVRPHAGGWAVDFVFGTPDPARVANLMVALPARSSEAA